MAERLDVRIVGVGARGAENEEIASAGAMAEPHKGLVQIFTAANERVARTSGHMDVVRIPDADVTVSGRSRSDHSWASQPEC